jgi:hypothetical protein
MEEGVLPDEATFFAEAAVLGGGDAAESMEY